MDKDLTCDFCGDKDYNTKECTQCNKKICFYNCSSKLYKLNNKYICKTCLIINKVMPINKNQPVKSK